jgi:tetratricopeptide (TPR) repeat protein
MTPIDSPEYRKLVLDSSNDLIRYDSQWILGEYTAAAFHALRAGIARTNMGVIKVNHQEFTQAAEDWLCAAHCFNLATRPQLARRTLDWVSQMEKDGKIPQQRRDLFAAIATREEEYKTLEQRLTELQHDVQRSGPSPGRGQETLDRLIRWLRILPGFWKLQALIFLQARQIGQIAFAVKHLDWADKLSGGDPRVVALRMYHLLLLGEPIPAAKIGQESLAQNSNSPLRYLAALALVSSSVDHTPDPEKALEVLKPLLDDSNDNSSWRLLALALAANLQHQMDQYPDSQQTLTLFNRLFDLIPFEERNRYAKLREFVNQHAAKLQLCDELLHLNGTFLSYLLDAGNGVSEPPLESDMPHNWLLPDGGTVLSV